VQLLSYYKLIFRLETYFFRLPCLGLSSFLNGSRAKVEGYDGYDYPFKGFDKRIG
jgi:hypothetical protein